AAAKVSQTEAAIGYTFNNKMLCVEALKMSGSATPLYCNGSVWPVANNNRLALLGDRALGMVICEIWFMTGNSTRDYSVAERNIVSRASLARSGCALGIQDKILFAASLSAATPDMIAETFEAIIGAVYAD
ncbi:ribonuclease III domain-containing protein, partial [Massariosphaeria phaeospora]